ncbi:MAG: hypothetical protein C4520_17525 [Candidatus Abyssobacteria bacterium SURF_5]|uniref:Uncharacterized protein n=1 Tax=Abyssobacteria bacterium (strain SURF_5) TaxID=2093360 RepID=A0A3A4NNR4_ABYX5|nr:MAG: hypothetical protein C4520_17525 [Candidatus Abyssubacteria bacterium SURF_5]
MKLFEWDKVDELVKEILLGKHGLAFSSMNRVSEPLRASDADFEKELSKDLHNPKICRGYCRLIRILQEQTQLPEYKVDNTPLFGETTEVLPYRYLFGVDWITRVLWWLPKEDGDTKNIGIRKAAPDHHIFHTLWVFLLGDMLLYWMDKPLRDAFYKQATKLHPSIRGHRNGFILKNDFMRYIWHFISFFHDSGYPLSALYNVSKVLSCISEAMPLIKQEATLSGALPRRQTLECLDHVCDACFEENPSLGGRNSLYTHYCHQYWSRYNLRRRKVERGNGTARIALAVAKRIIHEHHWHRHNFYKRNNARRNQRMVSDPFLFLLALVDGIQKFSRYETITIKNLTVTADVDDKVYLIFAPQRKLFQCYYWRDFRKRERAFGKCLSSTDFEDGVNRLFNESIGNDILDCCHLNEAFRENPLDLQVQLRSLNVILLNKKLRNASIIKRVDGISASKKEKKYLVALLQYLKTHPDLNLDLVDTLCHDFRKSQKQLLKELGGDPSIGEREEKIEVFKRAVSIFSNNFLDLVNALPGKNRILKDPGDVTSYC